jgi:hypothetical protein
VIRIGQRVRVIKTGDLGRVLRSFPRVGIMLDDLAVARLDKPDWTGVTIGTWYERELEIISEEGRATA